MPKTVVALALALISAPVWAEDFPPLPREQIIQAYKGGELDSVLLYIKEGRSKPMFKDRNDSILAFKCLGVIYASDPVRREKGRYYFNLLLGLDPTASITDFYPSETIRQVFKEVRDDFMELHPEWMVTMRGTGEKPSASAKVGPDTSAAAPVAPTPSMEPVRPKSHLGWWLAGGAVVAAGAGTVTYFALTDEPSTKVFRVHD